MLIATGIVPGVLAERSRFFALCGASILLAAVLVPVVGHWAWSGWLRELGFIDVAGASVIHLSGAMCAAAGAVMVGPRMGKYNRDGSSNAIPGHNVPLASAGNAPDAHRMAAVRAGLRHHPWGRRSTAPPR